MLLKNDERRNKRQLAIIDMKGRAANRNPSNADPSGVYWGAMSGQFYACQGNTLTGREVIVAMAKAYEETEGSLTDRLMAALVAADCAGGDHRGRLAAGIRIAKTGVDGFWFELYTDQSQDAVADLLKKYVKTEHPAKGVWSTESKPFSHSCNERSLQEINPPSEPSDPTKIIALVGGRLIDGRGGLPVNDSVVIVKGSKIIAVGARDTLTIPTEAETVDIQGLSLLPGLIDSHFHSKDSVRTPVEFELKHGITSFRDPGHPFRFYDAVKKSNRMMPRVFLCGGHLDAHPPVWADQAIVIRDSEHARNTVNEHVDRGASAIKVYFRLPLEHIAAVCEAADKRNVFVTAHLELVDADDAIKAGVRGIEHVTSFGTALAKPDRAKSFKAQIFADSNARRKLRPWLWAGINLDSSPRVKPLLETLVKHQVFVSPTLAIFEARVGEKNTTSDQVNGFANMIKFVGLCRKAGAKIVVGSHTSAPFAESGRAYQRELELLVEAGLSPMEAIRSATQINAQFFGIDDRLGTIEIGKTADLTLVDGDPSQDIAAMRSVKHVMLNGIWVGESP
ncbi:MAG TPA: DUF1028 domain-containing protein [Verrucomicrobiales bacterium]|nr:DUF1028 domain-containing protein [Verrucomicrobiales bacterium]